MCQWTSLRMYSWCQLSSLLTNLLTLVDDPPHTASRVAYMAWVKHITKNYCKNKTIGYLIHIFSNLLCWAAVIPFWSTYKIKRNLTKINKEKNICKFCKTSGQLKNTLHIFTLFLQIYDIMGNTTQSYDKEHKFAI